MSIAQTQSILQQIKEMELIAKKNTTSMFAGNYLSTVLGHGMEFYEARKYIEGESIRLIDWNMTARIGEVYVKKLREEREREIFIAIDVSPSMFFGTQKRTKYETAVELAATLGYSVIDNNDKLGFACFSDKLDTFFLPKKGKSHFFRFLKTLVDFKNKPPKACQKTDMGSAINAIQKQKSKKFLIFIISDFIEDDIPEDLRLIQKRHEVTLLHTYDPFEYEPSNKVFFPFCSPEGKANANILHPGELGNLLETQYNLKGHSLKFGIDMVSVSTNDLINKKLMGYFKEKQKRRTF